MRSVMPAIDPMIPDVSIGIKIVFWLGEFAKAVDVSAGTKVKVIAVEGTSLRVEEFVS